MQSHPKTDASGSPEQGENTRSLARTGGTLLALAALVTAGTFLTARHNGWGAHSNSAIHAAVVTAVQPGGNAVRALPAGASVLPTTNQSVAAPAVYFVASQEQARRLQVAFNEGDDILAAMGQAPVGKAFEVVDSPESEAQVWRNIADLNNIRVGMGLPGVTVIDLRD